MNAVMNLSSSPHARDKWTTAFIMKCVLLALLPVTLVGIFTYGWNALLVVVLAVVSAVLTEAIFDKLTHRPDTWKDYSAAVTGLMLALTLSPLVPWYIPVLGSFFAIFVAKCCFGGIGRNFINPALAGRCFLMVSFSRQMTQFPLDGVSAATPIASLAQGNAVDITRMFLGGASGVIGSSVLAILIGGLVLWAFDFIHGQICFSVLGSFTLVLALFGGQGFDPKFLLAHLCGGGVMMGAFFMASDYVTSPVSRLGQFTYGVLIGTLGALFRIMGGSADAFSYSVIIGNLCTPLIDTYIVQKPYAYRHAAKRAQAGDTRPWYRCIGSLIKEYIYEKGYKRIPKAVKTLMAIMLIAGFALSGAYSVTKAPIAKQHEQARIAAFRAVLPEAAAFEEDDSLTKAIVSKNGAVWGEAFGTCRINEALKGVDAQAQTVGYVVSVSTKDGYKSDPITLTVGLLPDGTVNSIAFTELNQTPGLGMEADKEPFKGQFAGKNVEGFIVVKTGSDSPNEIDSISGATTTSQAVVNAVNAALDFFNQTVKGGVGE